MASIGSVHDEEPRMVPRDGGSLRDQRFGKIIVKSTEIHGATR